MRRIGCVVARLIGHRKEFERPDLVEVGCAPSPPITALSWTIYVSHRRSITVDGPRRCAPSPPMATRPDGSALEL